MGAVLVVSIAEIDSGKVAQQDRERFSSVEREKKLCRCRGIDYFVNDTLVSFHTNNDGTALTKHVGNSSSQQRNDELWKT